MLPFFLMHLGILFGQKLNVPPMAFDFCWVSLLDVLAK